MSKKQKLIAEDSFDDESESHSEEDEEVPKKSDAKKRKKSSSKKSGSAYSLYMKKRGGEIKKENPELSFGDRSKKLSAEWAALSDAEKKPYYEKAAEEKKINEKEKLKNKDKYDGPSKKKKAKDPNAPKKNKNAYMFYTQHIRPQVVEELGPNESKKTTQVTKVIGSRWNQLSSEEKKPYQDLANKDKERYEKEFNIYKKRTEVK